MQLLVTGSFESGRHNIVSLFVQEAAHAYLQAGVKAQVGVQCRDYGSDMAGLSLVFITQFTFLLFFFWLPVLIVVY
jgi:hypothetical protein